VTIRVLGDEGAEIAKRISGLSPSGDKFKEFQIRPLSSVKPKHQADVWREAVETALAAFHVPPQPASQIFWKMTALLIVGAKFNISIQPA
jgi:hypothetical protein